MATPTQAERDTWTNAQIADDENKKARDVWIQKQIAIEALEVQQEAKRVEMDDGLVLRRTDMEAFRAEKETEISDIATQIEELENGSP